MGTAEYTFRCVRGLAEPEWSRLFAHPSDEAAVEEARLLLQSQLALSRVGPVSVQVARGREDALTWLGAWRWADGARWEPGEPKP